MNDEAKIWIDAKYGSDIREAGIATVGRMDLIKMQQVRDYKFTRRHTWRVTGPASTRSSVCYIVEDIRETQAAHQKFAA